MRARRGFVLIAVTGIAMALLMLALAFLQTMRADAERVRSLEHEARCRAMLTAACSYVMESSRIGWGSGNSTDGWHGEAFGWRDIRDSTLAGPRGVDGRPVPGWTPGSGQWPDPGSSTRCTTYRMLRPPFAMKQTRVYNELRWDNRPTTGSNYGSAVTLWNPNPQSEMFTDPATNAAWAAERDAAWLAHCQGDRRPTGMAYKPWFRLYRRTAPDFDTFVVTCGSGGTWGFKDWTECAAYNTDAANAGRIDYQAIADQATFALLRAGERLLWFEVRWSPAVVGRMGGMALGGMASALRPPNLTIAESVPWYGTWGFVPDVTSQAGTISYIQRLTPQQVGTTW